MVEKIRRFMYDLRKFPKHYWLITIFALCLILLFVMQIYIRSDSETYLEQVVHIVLTITALLFMHTLDQLMLSREIIEKSTAKLNEVVKDNLDLLKAVRECNIDYVYPNRRKAEVAMMKDIRGAKDRTWLLGVGLNVVLDLDKVVPTLIKNKRKKADFDLRILMLDAFRSTAVFRTFLESGSDAGQEMIDYYVQGKQGPSGDNVYFGQQLCRKLESACLMLYGNKELEDSVKFYAHTPACWLVLTDDKAYFQPYTFGGYPQALEENIEHPSTSPDPNTIGDLMPVFKFQDGPDSLPFKVIEDHFKKLWATSDTDLFHIQRRQSAKESLVREIFKKRGAWLAQVKGVLYSERRAYEKKPNEPNYRKYARQMCSENVSVIIEPLDHQGDQSSSTPYSAKIHDSSRWGLALEQVSESLNLREGSSVCLKLNADKPSVLTQFYSEKLLKDCKYTVKHMDTEKHFVRLEKLSNSAH